MKFKRQTRVSPDINLTPLIDVVFLLLIFFMVTTTFVEEGKLSISLPEADTAETTIEPKVIEVVVDAEGRFAVNGKVLTTSNGNLLTAAINEASAGDINVPFVITADANSSHQSVVTVMDVAGKAGFTNISITTLYSNKK